jgi:enoyl reductase-like protein
MTVQQQTRQALSQNWDQAKNKIRQAFPDAHDDDFNAADPDAFVASYASRTGKPMTDIERQLDQVARNQTN